MSRVPARTDSGTAVQLASSCPVLQCIWCTSGGILHGYYCIRRTAIDKPLISFVVLRLYRQLDIVTKSDSCWRQTSSSPGRQDHTPRIHQTLQIAPFLPAGHARICFLLQSTPWVLGRVDVCVEVVGHQEDDGLFSF